MVTGIALFGVITANLAAFMVEERNDPGTDADAGSDPDDDDRLDQVLRRLEVMGMLLMDERPCIRCGRHAHQPEEAPLAP